MGPLVHTLALTLAFCTARFRRSPPRARITPLITLDCEKVPAIYTQVPIDKRPDLRAGW
jgi:hypothetical protein